MTMNIMKKLTEIAAKQGLSGHLEKPVACDGLR